MYARLPAFVLGFHGCDREVGEAVLAGKEDLQASQNDYDWLGNGIYFWENSYQRAREYATTLASGKRRQSASKIRDPFVVGAIIDLGRCLNLMDQQAINSVQEHYQILEQVLEQSGEVMPTNVALRSSRDLVLRHLDCAVFEFLHDRRRIDGMPAYDSVRGAFWEGPEIYPGAGIREKNHIQICVRSADQILGYFRPRAHVMG